MAKHFSLTSAKLRERKMATIVKARFQFHPYFLSDEISDEPDFFLAGDKNGSVRAWSMSLKSFPMVTQFLGRQLRSTLGGRNS